MALSDPTPLGLLYFIGSAVYIETQLTQFHVDADRYHENAGATGTINAVGDVKITMKNTEFARNIAQTSVAGMYVEKSVDMFTCYRCLFRNNSAQSDSALIVSNAEMFSIHNVYLTATQPDQASL